MTLAGSWHRLSSIFNAAQHLRKGLFSVQILGSIIPPTLPIGRGRASPFRIKKQKSLHFFGEAPERRPWAIKREDRPAAFARRSKCIFAGYSRVTCEYPVPPFHVITRLRVSESDKSAGKEREKVDVVLHYGLGNSCFCPLFGRCFGRMLVCVVHHLGDSRKSAREALPSRLFCFAAGFSGSPNRCSVRQSARAQTECICRLLEDTRELIITLTIATMRAIIDGYSKQEGLRGLL